MKVHLLNIISCVCPNVEPQSTTISLSDWADIAQVIIAVANLALAGYLLTYQKNKDKQADSDTAKLNEQNIKLQWFKELVVQPNMQAILDFYSNLQIIESKITSNDLTIEEKEDINSFVKSELSKLRKSFIDVLYLIDKKFADQLMINLDGLVDGITNAIFNDELKLKVPTVYEKHIGSKISFSKNSVIAQMYNYKGIASI